MTTKLSLQDALDLMDSDDIESLLENPDLQEFLNDIQDMGIEILKGKDENYLTGLVSLIQACGIVGLINGGDASEIIFAMELMTRHNDAYGALTASMLKYAVGILALEELH